MNNIFEQPRLLRKAAASTGNVPVETFTIANNEYTESICADGAKDLFFNAVITSGVDGAGNVVVEQCATAAWAAAGDIETLFTLDLTGRRFRSADLLTNGVTPINHFRVKNETGQTINVTVTRKID